MADEDDEVARARKELERLMDEFDVDSPSALVRTLQRKIATLEREIAEREDTSDELEEKIAAIDAELAEIADALEYLEGDDSAH